MCARERRQIQTARRASSLGVLALSMSVQRCHPHLLVLILGVVYKRRVSSIILILSHGKYL